MHIYNSFGPTILVDGGRCKLNNIKISFFSPRFLDPKKETATFQNFSNNQQVRDMSQGEAWDRQKMVKKYSAKDADVDTLHCLLLQKGGTLTLDNCQMSMMFSMEEKLVSFYSAVVALEGANLKMNKCEVKSQRIPGLIGVSTIYADAAINESRIYDNCGGGIYLLCNERNTTQVLACNIYRNKIAGVYVEGLCPKVLMRKYAPRENRVGTTSSGTRRGRGYTAT